MKLLALLNEHNTEKLIKFILFFEFPYFFFSDRKALIFGNFYRFCHNIRLTLATLRGKHTHTAGEIVIDLHEADSDKAVEPGISDLLDHSFISGLVVTCPFVIFYTVCKIDTLFNILACNLRRLACTHIVELELICRAFHLRLDTVLVNTEKTHTVCDNFDQITSCPYREVFDFCFIHILPLYN